MEFHHQGDETALESRRQTGELHADELILISMQALDLDVPDFAGGRQRCFSSEQELPFDSIAGFKFGAMVGKKQSATSGADIVNNDFQFAGCAVQ